MTTKISIYSDGGARGNPGPAAFAYLICSESGDEVCEHAEKIGQTTNNVAEYSGVIHALERAAAIGASEISFFTDSELVQRQLTGVYRVKTPHILELFQKVVALQKKFQKISYQHVPRTHEKIRHVDRLVNQVLDGTY